MPERKKADRAVAEAAAARVAEKSRRGDVNGYVCTTCSNVLWTIDKVPGVTPFMTTCRAPEQPGRILCRGIAESMCYRVPAEHPEPTHEWYRPEPEWVDQQETKFPGCVDHYHGGGLWIREIPGRVERDFDEVFEGPE